MLQYSEQDLKNALADIRENGNKIREASRKFVVPKTLIDRLSGRRPDKVKKPGPSPILTEEGEKRITKWVIDLAKCGFPVQKDMLLETVAKISKETGKELFKNNMPGQSWYLGFLRRNPEISVREAESINKARAVVSERTIRNWFLELEDFLKKNDLTDIFKDPSRIFNCDESGFCLCPKSGKVLGPRGYKNLYSIKLGNEKENITVLMMFNAAGKISPPLVLFPYVRPPRAVVENMPIGWVLGKSEKGWMTSDVFFEYIANDFNKWAVENNIPRPLLIFVDGHKSHMTLALSKWCEENQVVLYALPPNTTHIMQPADVSVFKPMKSDWKKTVRNWQNRSENINSSVNKVNFCGIFHEVLSNTEAFAENIKNGFRKSGLYPLDPNALDYTKCVKDIAENLKTSTTKQRRSSEGVISQRDIRSAKKVILAIKENLNSYGVNTDVILNEITCLQETIAKISPSKRGSVDKNMIIQERSLELPSKPLNTEISTDYENSSRSIVPNKSIFQQPFELIDPDLTTNRDADISMSVLPDVSLGSTFTATFINDIQNIDSATDIIFEFSDLDQNCSSNVSMVHDYVNNHKTDIPNRDLNIINNLTVVIKTDVTSLDSSEINNNSQIIDKSEEENNPRAVTNSDVIKLNSIVSEDNDSKSDTVPNQDIYLNPKASCSNEDSKDYESPQRVTILEPITNRVTPQVNKAFDNHLIYPDPIKRSGNTNRQKNSLKTPSAVSSSEWRKYYQEKENAKTRKKLDMVKKREEREKLKQNKQKKTVKTKQKKPKKKQVTSPVTKPSDKIPCAKCNEELNSDTDDDDKKNIGCDLCDNWYHKKCTNFIDTPYHIAAIQDYKCDKC
ncbi:hypothetical protein NQ315_005636 [Exocentrus adspersus]|uniref:Transposase n=1 Tax=Exocentrus adspersus TaxID=1586481 RepID=A0AAV8V6X6_9CUCU|nr:hypothetical protein NQ315_005636 [Exocentrus adspersus]